jgi:putative ABC transport system permease protein
MGGIAWRNFVLQFHRYRVLATALVLGAIVFTVLFGVTESLTRTVREKAARYFSGDVMVLGMKKPADWIIHDEPAIELAFSASDLNIAYHHRRSIYYEYDAKLIFNGVSLVQRRVIGLDFAVERANFSKQEFVEGGLPEGALPEDGLWVSNDTAQRLHLRVGDEVVLMVKTTKGFRNTITLHLVGVFQDSSFFGFASYLDYRTLNKVLARPPEAITELGITLASDGDSDAGAKAVWRHLKSVVPTLPWVGTLDAAYAWSDANNPTVTTYAVLPLSGRLKQINDLIQAIYAVNALLAIVFLLVVAIGVYNTYQMIAFERTREIGTMRALGMQRGSVVSLFLTESLMLGLLSSAVGLLLGAIVLWSLGQIDFSGNLMTQMFLQKGHVAWAWAWPNVLAVVAVMWLTTLTGAIRPALRAALARPVEALRQE